MSMCHPESFSVVTRSRQVTEDVARAPTSQGVPSNCRTIGDAVQPLERLHRFAAVAFFYFANLGIKSIGLKMLPSSLVGMILIFALLLVLEKCGGSTSADIFWILEPGYRFLLKWAPLFFMPALVKLPCTPEHFSVSELLGLVVLLFGGLLVELVVTAGVASLFPALEQVGPELETLDSEKNSPAASSINEQLYPRPGMPFERRWLLLYVAVMLMAVGFFHAGLMPEAAEDCFMICASLLGLVAGNSLPLRVRRIAHPMLITLIGSWVAAWMWAAQTGSAGFLDVLENYDAGAGAYFVMLLQPLVVALGLLLYERRDVLSQHLVCILTTSFVAAVSGLFGTALLARMLGLPLVLSKAALTRFLTSPLALEAAEFLDSSKDLAIAIVTVSCLLSALVGEVVLSSLRVQSAHAQGLAMGASAAVFGTVSLTSWAPKAVPYSAVSFVVVGAMSVVLTSLSPVKDALLYIIG